MTNLSLFDDDEDRPGLVRRDHPDTAYAAAARIAGRTGTMRRRVYDRIVESGSLGLTDHELQRMLTMNPSTERPRRRELETADLIVDSGRRRMTPSGCRAIVWVAS